ncbi:MAG: radical SAM (seleno)protein TrsS [Acidobacteriota bacterium]
MTSARILSTTESLCPVCLTRIAAERVAEGDAVYLRKTCAEHGEFRTILWRGLESYAAWGAGCRTAARPPVCASEVERGCPFDCGLCPDHRQHTCCVVLDVTERCNLACPVCFASAGSATAKADPTVDEIVGWCRRLLELGGPFNLHLSGGEPTVRRDLPEILRRVRALGFTYIQLNTNGVRLAVDSNYARELKEAGLTCVFLQFDGVSDEVFRTIRGKPLLETKLQAIANCGRHELGVVLVPTLVPGVNTGQIGDILREAIRLAPAVRAVHFQPVSYFGRYPAGRTDADRITFPEVLRLIEEQTQGIFRAKDFYPASGENPYCSFHGKFWLDAEKRIAPAPRPQVSSCCGPAVESRPPSTLVQLGAPKPMPSEGVRRAQQFVAQHWSYPEPPAAARIPGGIDISSFDRFLADKKTSFCISGMAFQDAWNLDLERLRECFLHVLSPGQKLVPLCAYNLTGATGQTLYRCNGAASSAGGRA